MNCATNDMGTLTEDYEETIEDRYNRCGLLNVIQHIDIYGKCRTSYVERRSQDTATVTSVSSSGRSFNSDVGGDVTDKLSRFSVSTRVSGLYPGHDILSRRVRGAGKGRVLCEKFGLTE